MIPNMFFFLLILLLPDLLVWLGLVDGAGLGSKVACSAISVLMLLMMAALYARWFGRLRRMRLFFLCFIMLAMPKTLFALVSWPFGFGAGIVVALLAMMVFAYGFIAGWLKLKVHQEVMYSKDLPKAFDGYRVLHFSDLHAGIFQRQPWFVDLLVSEMCAQKADLMVFTGDLVNLNAVEILRFMPVLSRAKAPDGVFAVLGNHDYYDKKEKLVRLETKMGWEVLNDENQIITRGDDSIAIVGVEHIGLPPFYTYGCLAAAMEGLPDGMFKILLSHNPAHWRMEVLGETDVQLTLSGHTHAAQMRLGRLSPARLMYREWGGWYAEGDRRLYVSAGLGGTVPFRLFAWPEITVIQLKCG